MAVLHSHLGGFLLLPLIPGVSMGYLVRSGPDAAGPTSSHVQAGSTSVSLPRPEMADHLSSEARFEELLALLISWAADRPEAALDYAAKYLKSEQHKETANRAIISVWAKKNPAAAWKWLAAMEAPGVDQIETVLKEMGKVAPGDAWRCAITMAREQSGAQSVALQSALQGAVFFGDFKGALRMIADSDLPSIRLPDGVLPDKDSLAAFVVTDWARYQPDAALAWAQTLSGGPEAHEQTLLALGQSLVAVNSSSARDLAVRLPEGKIRQAMLTQTLMPWAMSDVLASRDWLRHFAPHPDFDEAAHDIAIMVLRGSHLDVAVEWAKSISNQQLSLDTLVEIMSRWIEQDREAGMEYLENPANFTPELRLQVRKRLPDES